MLTREQVIDMVIAIAIQVDASPNQTPDTMKAEALEALEHDPKMGELIDKLSAAIWKDGYEEGYGAATCCHTQP